jgi:hypothetical protein
MPGGLQGARVVESFTSEWDLSAKQYRAVHLGSADDKVVTSSAYGTPCFGVVMNKPSSGEEARVCIGGYTKVIAGDTVTRGTFLVSNSFGYLVGATLPGSANVLAQAMQSVASGSVFSALLMPHQRTLAP